MLDYSEIRISDNAYVYRKLDSTPTFDKEYIGNLFQGIVVALEKGQTVKRVIRHHVTIDKTDVPISLLVFSFVAVPSFVDRQSTLREKRMGYILILDFPDHIVLSKKNAVKLSSFLNTMQPLDYSLLSRLYVDDKTRFEMIRMQNIDPSDSVIRTKTLQALNLRESFVAYGANKYAVSAIRLNNSKGKVSVSLNTSHINELGAKDGVVAFVKWGKELIDMIRHSEERRTYLDIFATPIRFEQKKEGLTPVALKILQEKFNSDFSKGNITGVYYESGESTRQLHASRLFSHWKELLELNEADGLFLAPNKLDKTLGIKQTTKSIRLVGRKLNKVKLTLADDTKISLLSYLNTHQCFMVYFDKCEYAYYNNTLFQDQKLLGRFDEFLSLFHGLGEMEAVDSEKGTFSPTDVEFSSKSIFGVVEKLFMPEFDFFICDDLKAEWADHIGIDTKDKRVSFFHSKAGDQCFSASAFHIIVGQALKNLGNLVPTDEQLEDKRSTWEKDYKNSKIQTRIKRLRKGDSVDNAIAGWKEIAHGFQRKLMLCLCVDFLSKETLQKNLKLLLEQKQFTNRNQTIQILWLLSSLVSACEEQGVSLKIYCCKSQRRHRKNKKTNNGYLS